MAVLVGGLVCPAQIVPPAPETQADVIRDIDAVERNRDANLAGYSVTEHYTIRNSHFQMAADVVVQAGYRRAAGKTYQVQSRSGPSILKDRLMDRILQEEANMSRGAAREQSLITSANYAMHLVGEKQIGDTRCLELDLTPRVNSPHLLRGKVWVDSGTNSWSELKASHQWGNRSLPVGLKWFAITPPLADSRLRNEAMRSHPVSFKGRPRSRSFTTII